MDAPVFRSSDLVALAKILGDAATGTELSVLIGELCKAHHFEEPLREANQAKWRRIALTLEGAQSVTNTGNITAKFIASILGPRRFVQKEAEFGSLRAKVNEILAFYGLHFRPDGRFGAVPAATTIAEARERADRLKSELERRAVHPDVLSFCREELVKEDYFHAVLEATKSVAAKIRSRTGLTGDGGDLATTALCSGKAGLPYLAFNPLLNDSEKSEQSGLANLFLGMFGTFRNPTAHSPKIHWKISEQDAVDLLSLVSMLHRRLDAATRTSRS